MIRFNEILNEPEDREYELAATMVGLTPDSVTRLTKLSNATCNRHPVRCILRKCPCLEQCYGLTIKQNYR